MKRLFLILLLTSVALFMSARLSHTPHAISPTLLERELLSLEERGLNYVVHETYVEAIDPVSQQRWRFPLVMLTPRDPSYTGLPTLTIDLRTIDTSLYNWRYRYLNTIPISTSWGFAIPIADVDGDLKPEAYGLFKTPENDIRTHIYEFGDTTGWTLTYTYPGEGGWVDGIDDLDADGRLDAFIRLGDSLHVYTQATHNSLPISVKFHFRQYYGEAFGIPNVVADMTGSGKKEVVYRGSEQSPQYTPKAYIATYDPSTNNLRHLWSLQMPPGCIGEECTASLATGDFDGDSLNDLVTSSFRGRVYVVEYALGDSFAVIWADTLSVAGRVTSGDVDGNGIEEFFVGGTQAEQDGFVHLRMFAYEKTGDNLYQPVFAFNIFPGGMFFVDQFQTADMDGDGQKELLLSFAGGVLIIKGNQTHQYSVFYYKPVSFLQGVAAGDIQSDGLSELFVSRRSQSGGWTEVYMLDSILTVLMPEKNQRPPQTRLHQNFPNPANPSTTMGFEVAEQGLIRITVHDLMGKEVEQLINDDYRPGTYFVTWNPGKYNGVGSRASGIYFVRLQTKNQIHVRKILYLK